MVDFIDEIPVGKVRNSDGFTSRYAANFVNCKDGWDVVIGYMEEWEDLTMGDIAEFENVQSDKYGPRFCELERMRVIRKVKDGFNNPITRRDQNRKGCPRHVYELQPNRALWKHKDPLGPTERQRRKRNSFIEEIAIMVGGWENTDEIVAEIRKLKVEEL